MIRGFWVMGWLLAAAVLQAKVPAYPYQGCFQVASRMHQVPLDLLLAVAATESNWDPAARSDANAHGIMQIQWPGTARHLGVGRVSELYNPCLNIELGARYLRELLNSNDGDVQRALASYNYGPTRIAKSPVLPAGAKAYAEKVQGHQARIIEREEAGQPDAGARYRTEMHFHNGLRARRYAKSLSARVESADFVAGRRADGTYAVRMSVGADGLSMGDRRLLQQVGWLSAHGEGE